MTARRASRISVGEVWELGRSRLLCGNSLTDLDKLFGGKRADAVLTDPPYGLKFMGKGWDKGVPGVEFWEAAMRVAKPGAMMLAFGGTRTHHRLMCAIEDAGWEIRDCMMWLYGVGFPKSHDIGKAIDKAAGAEREVVGRTMVGGGNASSGFKNDWPSQGQGTGGAPVTAPATDAAKLWDGWGTALKPAWEPIILAMKPCEGTYAANALKHGVAGLNVDGGRVEAVDGTTTARKPAIVKDTAAPFGRGAMMGGRGSPDGRWPANLILDEAAGALLDAQSGELPAGTAVRHNKGISASSNVTLNRANPDMTDDVTYGGSGGASRFFYCAKASRKERGLGNNHPTVKPLALLRYLLTLLSTPTGGIVLDTFVGSGSTILAAEELGRTCYAVDERPEYCSIVIRRWEKLTGQKARRVKGARRMKR